jgi:hypothetical protein
MEEEIENWDSGPAGLIFYFFCVTLVKTFNLSEVKLPFRVAPTS